MVEVVTIANFGDAIEASLAKQDLEAEGITAFLADEITVNMAWYLTVALRWIKLQVPEPEAEQAMSILAATRDSPQFVFNEATELITQETLSSDPEEEFQATLAREDDDDVVRLSWAERTVERMFRVAVLGLIFLPLHLYSLWLLIRLVVSRRRVPRNKYWKVVMTMILNAPIMAILGIIFL
ncbi:MAG: putative signal transducing protein [Microcystaceae cyanobacterium]